MNPDFVLLKFDLNNILTLFICQDDFTGVSNKQDA